MHFVHHSCTKFRQFPEESPHCIEEPSHPEVIMKENIGKWCIVNYDCEPHQEIIQEVEDVKEKCMCKNGTNKFFWLSPREDINWYRDEQIVCLMKESQPLNKRYVQLEKTVSNFIKKNTWDAGLFSSLLLMLL